MKRNIFKGLIAFAFIAVAGISFAAMNVSADAVYDVASEGYGSSEALSSDGLTLEQMLIYALQDEYMAQAEYQAIIATYGDIRPFTNIVNAEATHIALLLPLFEAYGIAIPENTAADNVVIPETITAALATGVQAEEMNIAMYQLFLSQGDLPDDVASAFNALMNASESHLKAFQKDRYSGLGTDVMNQIRNRFQFKNSYKNGNQYQNGEKQYQQYCGQ